MAWESIEKNSQGEVRNERDQKKSPVVKFEFLQIFAGFRQISAKLQKFRGLSRTCLISEIWQLTKMENCKNCQKTHQENSEWKLKRTKNFAKNLPKIFFKHTSIALHRHWTGVSNVNEIVFCYRSEVREAR